MAFEVVQPAPRLMNPLDDSEFALMKSGCLRAHLSLLEGAEIGDKVAVLVDREFYQLAIRKPADGEPSYSVLPEKNGKTAKINISPALKTLGLPHNLFGGRCEPREKDGMLVVHLQDFTSKTEDFDEAVEKANEERINKIKASSRSKK